MDRKLFDLKLRALVYEEDGLIHARCLEMDLVGTGRSEKAATCQLQELIQEHITFAQFEKDDGLILFAADQTYFDRWENANQSAIRNQLFPDKFSDKALYMSGKAVFLTISKSELEKLRKSHRFNPVPETILA